MKYAAILENMSETQERLNALHGLMDMAESMSQQEPREPRWDYLTHVARLVHSMVDDIQMRVDETASELMAAMDREKQRA
jgi:hypothetical protein